MSQTKDAAIGRMSKALRHIEALDRLLEWSATPAEQEFILGRLRSILHKDRP